MREIDSSINLHVPGTPCSQRMIEISVSRRIPSAAEIVAQRYNSGLSLVYCVHAARSAKLRSREAWSCSIGLTDKTLMCCFFTTNQSFPRSREISQEFRECHSPRDFPSIEPNPRFFYWVL